MYTMKINLHEGIHLLFQHYSENYYNQISMSLMKILNINVYGILPMWFCFLYEPNSCLYLILCTLNKCDSAYSYYGRQEYHSHKERFLMTMWLWEYQKATDLGVSARL